MCILAGVVTGLRMRTGFSPLEIFRKYMWYQEAVDDMVYLKQVLSLKDEQVEYPFPRRSTLRTWVYSDKSQLLSPREHEYSSRAKHSSVKATVSIPDCPRHVLREG